MNQLILIGMPRSGKSLIGEMLAQKLGRTFFDTDQLIEKTYNAPLSQLAQNEAHFRTLESDVFKNLLDKRDCVIATGGGTPIHTPQFDQLTNRSKVIFLYTHWDVLWGRIAQEGAVPPFLDQQNPLQSFQELYKSRLVHYLNLSHHRVDTGQLTVDEILERILQL